MADFFSFFAFFEVCCFLLLVYFLKRIFSSYVLDFIKRALTRKQEVLKGLHDQYANLQEENKQAEVKGVEQKVYAQTLLEKIDQWYAVENQRHEKLKKQRKESQGWVRDYLHEQTEWLATQHASQEVLPEVLKEAEQELIDRFKKEQEQDTFLNNVVDSLEGVSK